MASRKDAYKIIREIGDILNFIRKEEYLKYTDELEEELEDLIYELRLIYNSQEKSSL